MYMTPVIWLIQLSMLEIKGFRTAKSISSSQACARQCQQRNAPAEAPGPSRGRHTTSPGGSQQGEQSPHCPPRAGSTATAPHRPQHDQPGAGGAQIQHLQELAALDGHGPSWDPKRLLGAAPDLVPSSGGTSLAIQHTQPVRGCSPLALRAARPAGLPRCWSGCIWGHDRNGEGLEQSRHRCFERSSGNRRRAFISGLES